MGKRRGAAALVVLVLAIVGFAQTSAGHAALRGAGLSASPPSYAALAFASPDQLPSQLFAQEALLDASFVITNSAPVRHAFDWTILEVQHGRTRQIAAGRTAAAAGGRAAVAREFLSSCVGGQLRVVVKLAAPRESIDFLATCWPGIGGTR
jgi:hypothetical protein